MIKESKYTSKLFGKQTKSFEIDTLEDLRELKNKYPAKQLYKFSDGCTSFRTLDNIKKELKGKTITLKNRKVVSLLVYHANEGRIKKLENNYVFTCETLRGYNNTYIVHWQTDEYYINVKTQNNLWRDITKTIETDKDKYAKHTVRAVKLIPLNPQIMTKEKYFPVIKWYGGNTTTYNIYEDKEFKEIFNHNLFYGERRFNK